MNAEQWKPLCVFLYLLHTAHQNIHSTRKVKTFLLSEAILAALHSIKGLLEDKEVALRSMKDRNTRMCVRVCLCACACMFFIWNIASVP